MNEFDEDLDTRYFDFRCDIFTDSFEAFLENETFTDVIFLCHDNSPVTCHKTILASVSDYLKKILEASDEETVYISVPDVTDLTIKILLNVLYGGETIGSKNDLYNLKIVLALFEINLTNTSISTTKLSVAQFVELNADKNITENLPIETVAEEVCESEDPLNVPDVIFHKNVSGYNHALKSIKPEPEDPDYNAPQQKKYVFPEIFLNINELLNNPNYSVLEEHNYFSYIIKESPRYTSFVHDITRKRIDFTAEQLRILEFAYREKKLEDKYCQRSLAISFGVSPHTISSWYYRRRQNVKKKNEDIAPNRTDFTAEQLRILELAYTEKRLEDMNCQKSLAIRFGVTANRVNSWYCNRGQLVKKIEDTAPNRIDFTAEQLRILELAYTEKRLEDKNCQKSLAISFGVSVDTVNCWYYHRRQVEKKIEANPILSIPLSGDPTNETNLNCYNDSEDTCSTLTAVDFDMHEVEDELFKIQDVDPLYFSEADVKDPLCTDDMEIEDKKIFWSDGSCSEEKKLFPFCTDENSLIQPENTSGTSHSSKRRRKSIKEKGKKRLTREQRNVLEENFKKKKYLVCKEVYHLAEVLGLSTRSVKTWFTNRRRKDSKGKNQPLKKAQDSESPSLSNKDTSAIGTVKSRNVKNNKKEKIYVGGEELNSFVDDDSSVLDSQTKKRTWSRTFVKSGNFRKKKKPRLNSAMHIKKEQHDVLEAAYKENKFPSKETQEKLAVDLGVPVNNVVRWFTRKRSDALTGGSSWRGYKVILTDALRDSLDEMYKENNCPDKESLLKISEKLNLPCRYVTEWFANRARQEEEGEERPTEDLKLFTETKRNTDSRNTRTSRIRVSDEHQEILEKAYIENKYLDKEYQQKLSNDLRLPLRIIIAWFHNRFLTYRRDLKRKRFTESQLGILENYFKQNKLEDKNSQQILAMELGATHATVRCWYYRRKQKEAEERRVKEKNKKSISDSFRNNLEKAYGQKILQNKDCQEKLAKKFKVPLYSVRNWYYKRCKKDSTASEKRMTRLRGKKDFEAFNHVSDDKNKGEVEDGTPNKNKEAADRIEDKNEELEGITKNNKDIKGRTETEKDEAECRTKDRKNKGETKDKTRDQNKAEGRTEDKTEEEAGSKLKYESKKDISGKTGDSREDVEYITEDNEEVQDKTKDIVEKTEDKTKENEDAEDRTENKSGKVKNISKDENKEVDCGTANKNKEKFSRCN